MRRGLLLAPIILAACSATMEPSPPYELPYATAYAVSPTSIAYLFTSVDGATTVQFEGTAIAAPTDGSGNPYALQLPSSTAIAVGTFHACVLSTTGTVHCWGDQSHGALGEHRACLPPEVEGGAPDCRLGVGVMPTQLPPVRAIAAGDDVTCVITKADARVVCWGNAGRLGGSRLPAFDAPTPVTLPGGAPLVADRLWITHGTVCALDASKALWCWGDGVGAPQQKGTGVIDAAFGAHHTCIIDGDGLHCAGDNRNGQAGDATRARQCALDRPCTVGMTKIDLDATRVVVGERHTCALLRDRRVACFGSNEVGQLGRTDAFLVGEIGVVLDDATELAAGYAHTCAHRADGTTWCWGNTFAQGY